MQSPIENDSLKLSIEGQTETQLSIKLLFQVLVRELHNSMLIPTEEGGPKDARDADNNTTISDSTLRNILTHQLKNMTDQYKVT